MVDEKDNGFEPAKNTYIQKIIYVFKDGTSKLDTNKTYWPRYKYDLQKKINKSLHDGFTVDGKKYSARDVESVTIVYPE